MSLPYKIEFFDRDFNFHGFRSIPKPNIIFDYITLDKTEIEIPNPIKLKRGWYAHVTQGADVRYQGIVTDIVENKKTMQIACKPLISLLDIKTYYPRHLLGSLTAEQVVKTIIESAYHSTDINQNLTGLEINTLTETLWSSWNLKDNIHSVYDLIIIKALECANIFVTCTIDPQSRMIKFDIFNNSILGKTVIEADLPNVLSRDFVFTDNYGLTNKVTIFNKENEAERRTFYADNYSAPVFWDIEYITIGEDDSFDEKAAERAAELLSANKSDNLIELKVLSGDKLIPDIAVGQICDIIHDGVVYTAVLTGIENIGEVQKLIFGSIRMDLTQILAIEKRKG